MKSYHQAGIFIFHFFPPLVMCITVLGILLNPSSVLLDKKKRNVQHPHISSSNIRSQ